MFVLIILYGCHTMRIRLRLDLYTFSEIAQVHPAMITIKENERLHLSIALFLRLRYVCVSCVQLDCVKSYGRVVGRRSCAVVNYFGKILLTSAYANSFDLCIHLRVQSDACVRSCEFGNNVLMLWLA